MQTLLLYKDFAYLYGGTCDLKTSLLVQEKHLAQRKKGLILDTFLFFELEECYTTGRLANTKVTDDIELCVLDRGGGATYHGPGQLVCYPLIKLRGGINTNTYLRWLEKLIICSLNRYGLKAHAKDGLTGVWIENRKIGFIGIKNSLGYMKHGFSINLTCDTKKFDNIIACGIENLEVTNLQNETGIKVSIEEFMDIILEVIAECRKTEAMMV